MSDQGNVAHRPENLMKERGELIDQREKLQNRIALLECALEDAVRALEWVSREWWVDEYGQEVEPRGVRGSIRKAREVLGKKGGG